MKKRSQQPVSIVNRYVYVLPVVLIFYHRSIRQMRYAILYTYTHSLMNTVAGCIEDRDKCLMFHQISAFVYAPHRIHKRILILLSDTKVMFHLFTDDAALNFHIIIFLIKIN